MSVVQVGINGFGRMGRLVVRAMREHPQLELVHVNEIAGGPTVAAHLLEFDTVHGRYPGTVDVADNVLTIDDQRVGFSEWAAPSDIPWADLGVDLVIEATGKFRTPDALEPHFRQGALDVVVACPVAADANSSDTVLNVVMGCNDDLYDPDRHRIVTAASCTTNCIAPVIGVLHAAIGIERGAITTLHDVTNTQVIVDKPKADLRRARSALNSLIPTSTGSAKAIAMIYPELAGKLDGIAVRVPMLNASLSDCVFQLAQPVTALAINELLRDAALGELAGVLGYEDRPLVSADYVNDTRSGIVDGPATTVIDGVMAKVMVWYDNEIGYVHRMAELAAKVADARTAADG